jgi:hypothetical protein
MAIIAGQVQTLPYQYGDSSQMIQSAQNLAMTGAQGISDLAGQAKDYFKQQGEKKKLVKQSSLQIDAALQLFPDLAPSFQGLKERMRDENIPLADRAAEAEVVANLINMGVGEMRNRSNMSIQQEQAMAESIYKEQQLGMEERRTKATEYRASQAGKPSYQLEKPIITGPDGRSYESEIPMPYNPKTGRFFDAAKGKEILDINEWGLGKPSHVDGEAMPTPTSQNDIIAPSTAYSFGKAVGGPDELQDKWTNKGYTSTGPNLVEGVVAVNTNKYPLGTIFKDSKSGKVYVAADRHGNKDSGVIDFFQNPENYTGGKTNKRLSIIGSIPKNKIPKTKEGMSQLIEQYSNVPDYSTSSNASQIDGALSMNGDMSQQAIGTPDQQAEVARMIEEGSGMATSQAAPSGTMPTEPRMAQPQPTQQAPQYKVRPGFVPVGSGAAQGTIMNAEQVKNLTDRGFKVDAIPTNDGNFTVSGVTTGGQTPRYTKTPQEELETRRLTNLDQLQSDVRATGVSAAQDIAPFKEIVGLLDASVKTGFGRQTLMTAKKILGADVSNEEQFQARVGELAMRNIALTKGAISDREMDYFKTVLSPNMGKTTEGNKKIIEFKLKYAERADTIAKIISKMQSQNADPYVIQSEIDKIIESTPLVTVGSTPTSPSSQAESDASFIQGFQSGE